MRQQSLLFLVDINLESRVFRVQIDQGNSVYVFRLREHVAINIRMLLPRMGVVNNQVRHRIILKGLTNGKVYRVTIN